MSVVGYASGVYDLFHIGHLNLLQRSRERCDRLIAGVATDEMVEQFKGYRPIVPWSERVAIVAGLRCVDEVYRDEDQDKRVAWRNRPFDVIFKGDDWRGQPKGDLLEAQMVELGVGVVYLPYTSHTSSSHLRDALSRLSQSL